MSQAGITRADKVAFLELHGWIRCVRAHGEKRYWKDPDNLVCDYPTARAYEIAKGRETT